MGKASGRIAAPADNMNENRRFRIEALRILAACLLIFLQITGFAAAEELPGQGLALVKKQALVGVIDSSGQEILPVAFESAAILPNHQIAVKQHGNFGVYDRQGQPVVPIEYMRLSVCSDGTFLLQDSNGKWGAVSSEGEAVLPFEYTEIYDGAEGVFCVQQANSYWRLVRAQGIPVDDNGYALLSNFSEGRIAAEINGTWGFLDYDGNVVVPAEYEAVRAFSHGMAAVKQKGLWGFIDAQGQMIIPPQFAEIVQGFQDGRAVVWQNGKFSVIDSSGKILFSKDVAKFFPFQDGVAEIRKKVKSLNLLQTLVYGIGIGLGQFGLPPDNMLQKNEKRGYVDSEGKEIVSTKYDAVLTYQDDVVVVMDNDRWGCLDREGKKQIELKYEALRSFHAGLSAAKLDGTWLIIDKHGKVKRKLPADIEDVGEYGMGMFPVKKGGKWGYMDAMGEIIIEPAYTDVQPFH